MIFEPREILIRFVNTRIGAVAGAVIDTGDNSRCLRCAPILRKWLFNPYGFAYMGRQVDKVKLLQAGWTWERV